LDASSGTAVPSAPTGGVLARSETPWHGLLVEHHRLQPMEMGAHELIGHRLVINIGSAVPFEWHSGAQWNQAIYAPGCFAMQSHGDFHAPRWHEPFEFLALALEPEWVRSLVGDQDVEFEERRGAIDPVITELSRRFYDVLYAPFPGHPHFADSLATAFTFHLLDHYCVEKARLRAAPKRLEGRLLKNVVEFAQDHLCDPLTLQDLASQAFLSPFHFTRQFKAATGLSPHQFLLHLRIEKAKQLIAVQWNLTEVALATGFYDQSHFIHAFKRVTGVTPKMFIANR
jgi:AraC family transcriptional regulator